MKLTPAAITRRVRAAGKRQPHPPAFIVKELASGEWYAVSDRIGWRHGPYDTQAEAQAEADKINRTRP